MTAWRLGSRPRKVWPDKLHKLWSVEVGGGLASPIVAGDHAYVHSRRGDEETVSAFELATGKLLWRDTYLSPFQLSSDASVYGAGPYATPTHHQGRLYTFGMNEVLSAYDAASGKLLWRLLGWHVVQFGGGADGSAEEARARLRSRVPLRLTLGRPSGA